MIYNLTIFASWARSPDDLARPGGCDWLGMAAFAIHRSLFPPAFGDGRDVLRLFVGVAVLRTRATFPITRYKSGSREDPVVHGTQCCAMEMEMERL
jgi:hypothetical protein